IGSHSVGHFPDFASLSIFPIGESGNTTENYRPEYQVDQTVGGTVTGELEVSRDLLNTDIAANVRSFRAGYLAFNLRLTNVMSDLGFEFNSTNSANDVLTNFPYFQRTNEAFSGVPTQVLEIPMTISDASKTLKLTEETMDIVVPNWVNILRKNDDNNAPTNLLIHPNKGWKLKALQQIIAEKPASVITYELNAFGDYWIARGNLEFDYKLNDKHLTIKLDTDDPIGAAQSIVLTNGQNLEDVQVLNKSGEALEFQSSNWKVNDLIISRIGNPVIVEPTPKQYKLIIKSQDEKGQNLPDVNWEVLSADSTQLGIGNTGSNSLDTLSFTNANANLDIILKTNKAEYTNYRVLATIPAEQDVEKTTSNSLITYLFQLNVSAKDSETDAALDHFNAKAFLDGNLLMEAESLESHTASLETTQAGHSLELQVIIEKTGYFISDTINLTISEGQLNSLNIDLIKETEAPKQFRLFLHSKDENSEDLSDVDWEILKADSTTIAFGNTGSNALDTLEFTDSSATLDIILKSSKAEYKDFRTVTTLLAEHDNVKTTINTLITYLYQLDITANDSETGVDLDQIKVSAFLNGDLLMQAESQENSNLRLETMQAGHFLDLKLIVERDGYIASDSIPVTIFEGQSNTLTYSLVKDPDQVWPVDGSTHRLAILDNSLRNNEFNKENYASAIQMADVAGVPYSVTDDLALATKMDFVLVTSALTTQTITDDEIALLDNYVHNGGILIAQGVENPALFDLFGISESQFKTNRYSIEWSDKKIVELKWIDDPLEKTIPLADPNYYKSVNSLGYETKHAKMLAQFEDRSVALSRNDYSKGKAYAFGVEWKDVVLRNLMNKDYSTQRTYSNGFEPASDVFMLVLRAIFTDNQKVAVYKHTSPGASTSALLITHDVDSRKIIATLPYFSNWEFIQGISAHYFVTTHYNKDEYMSAYYEEANFEQLRELLDRNHTIGSHSVTHAPDFASTSVFPIGMPGNTQFHYQPMYNGSFTTGGTLYGELEVSRDLLNTDLNANVRSFRSGAMAFNIRLANVLDDLGYAFNSSMNANDVLTNFPYFQRTNKAFSGTQTSVLELPLTLTDRSSTDKLEETNIDEVVNIWKEVITKNNENNAPTTLLISPNREWKLQALQGLLASIPESVITYNFEDYGDYWLDRKALDFDYSVDKDSMTITLKTDQAPALDLSLIIEHGEKIKQFIVKDANGANVSFIAHEWNKEDVIITFGELAQSARTKSEAKIDVPALIEESPFNLFPNPARTYVNLLFDLTMKEDYTLKIVDINGRLINTFTGTADEGSSMQRIDLTSYSKGIYLINFETSTIRKTMKLTITD
ncbi:MAG: T9SS type A sorting domain-containing protein, partial [Bacteroidales bacterium]|nr:T9SS type A sorting domain-containing protein [Bacteroidales bacterium]